MSESAMPQDGALSVDEAIASLDPRDDENYETTAEASPADDAWGGDETPADGDETDGDGEPAELTAPLYWKPEAKAKFYALDPELQAEILSQEGPREQAAAKAKAQAAEISAAAQRDMAQVQTLAEQLASYLPQALATFQSRWGAQEPNWVQIAQTRGAENALALKSQYDAEQRQLSKVAHANQAAQTNAHQAFVQTEWRMLAQIAPELAPDAADPRKGADRRQAVMRYLAADGFPKEVTDHISAREMRIVHKALLWDHAQAALRGRPSPNTPATPGSRTAVRPAAALPGASPQRSASKVAHRFAQSRSVDDAVALLASKG